MKIKMKDIAWRYIDPDVFSEFSIESLFQNEIGRSICETKHFQEQAKNPLERDPETGMCVFDIKLFVNDVEVQPLLLGWMLKNFDELIQNRANYLAKLKVQKIFSNATSKLFELIEEESKRQEDD